MSILSAIFFFTAVFATYLALLAVTVILSDETLARINKLAQAAIAIFIPVIGPVTVLFMAHTVSPALLRWVPWPFKAMVADRSIKRYSSLEEQTAESDASGL